MQVINGLMGRGNDNWTF